MVTKPLQQEHMVAGLSMTVQVRHQAYIMAHMKTENSEILKYTQHGVQEQTELLSKHQISHLLEMAQ